MAAKRKRASKAPRKRDKPLARKSTHKPGHERAAWACWGAVSFVGLAALLGWLDGMVWLGNLCRELPLQLGLVALSTAGLCLWARRRGLALVALLSALIAVAPLWPLARPTRLTPERGPVLRVGLANLNEQPADPARLRTLAPTLEVLALTGLRQADLATLDASLPRMARLATASSRSASHALWVSTNYPARRRPAPPPSIAATRVRVGRCDVDLFSAMLPSLFDLGAAQERKDANTALSKLALGARAVSLVSLGSRPTSPDLRDAKRALSLRDTRLGKGLLATQPAALGPLGIAVEHVLVRGWIAVRERTAGFPVSPHASRTALATLELTEPRCR